MTWFNNACWNERYEMYASQKHVTSKPLGAQSTKSPLRFIIITRVYTIVLLFKIVYLLIWSSTRSSVWPLIVIDRRHLHLLATLCRQWRIVCIESVHMGAAVCIWWWCRECGCQTWACSWACCVTNDSPITCTTLHGGLQLTMSSPKESENEYDSGWDLYIHLVTLNWILKIIVLKESCGKATTWNI